MSFASMKKNRMSFEDLSTQLEDAGGTGSNKSYQDERLWYPKLDENKNGYAVIRFLPSTEDGKLPFVQLYNHGFKGETGKWLFENCPTTKREGHPNGEDCPVCEANREVTESYGGWDSTPESVKNALPRRRKRKLSYYSNIYVVSDPETPENEGKVFIFKYGKRIFDQLSAAAKPPFPDKAAIQPFDMWKGANYKLKIRQVEKQTNYDSSEFELESQFLSSDEAMEAVFNQQYNLSELVADDKFSSYEDIKKNLNRVEGGDKAASTAESVDKPASEPAAQNDMSSKPKFKDQAAKPAAQTEAPKAEVDENGFDEDDDAMNYFAGLAEDE